MIRQNLHCHTTFDDGEDAPERMVLAASDGRSRLHRHLAALPDPGRRAGAAPKRTCRFSSRRCTACARPLPGVFRSGAGWSTIWTPRGAERAPYDYIIGSCHLLGGISIDDDPDDREALIAYFGGAERAAEVYYRRVRSMADYPEIAIVGHFDLPTKYNERVALYDTAAPPTGTPPSPRWKSSARRARSLRSTPAPSPAAGARRPTPRLSCCGI